MATLRERDVFEYCENLFEKLKKDDGGYYPHKHDRMVFEQTAEHFSISEENVRKIYDSYTKLAAQIEMLKIKRLPKKKQQQREGHNADKISQLAKPICFIIKLFHYFFSQFKISL